MKCIRCGACCEHEPCHLYTQIFGYPLTLQGWKCPLLRGKKRKFCGMLAMSTGKLHEGIKVSLRIGTDCESLDERSRKMRGRTMKTIEEARAALKACETLRLLPPVPNRVKDEAAYKEWVRARRKAKLVLGAVPCTTCCPECTTPATIRWVFPELENDDG